MDDNGFFDEAIVDDTFFSFFFSSFLFWGWQKCNHENAVLDS